MLRKIHSICHSLLSSLEIIAVLTGSKKNCRIIMQNEKELSSFLKDSGLLYAVSDFSVQMKKDGGADFSNKGITGAEGFSVAYISKNQKTAEEAKMMEKHGNHRALGHLLGYPSCCCDFFEKHIVKGNYDLTADVAHSTPDYIFPWQTNICLRCFDMALLSHFPCSFRCSESIRLAEQNLLALDMLDRDMGNLLRKSLKTAVIYAEGVGVYALPRLTLQLNTASYNPQHIIPSARNSFFDLLSEQQSITVLSSTHFFVGKVNVEDERTFFALFV